ncbi:hypothetical protein SNE40_013903 [Patella caerulea]|uniref:UspA domain-containing protein n=1 Tax=Patella caerulea TaxID=87958 RepID=A0AAN8PI07_PATCE
MAESKKSKRTIIIAVDGSKHADYALEWYNEYFRNPNDYVILVNNPEYGEAIQGTWDGSIYVLDPEVIFAMLQEEKQRLNEEVDKYKHKLTDLGIEGRVRGVAAASPGEAIVKAADEEEADLVIVGCRGRGKIRRTLMGSVSDYVVHHCAAPVLICRH